MRVLPRPSRQAASVVFKGMAPHEIVEILIKSSAPVCARRLIDASVHLPSRSSRWVATFRDATGRQVWRSTGLRNRRSALRQAKSWEAQARQQRAAQGGAPRKPTIRVRPGSGEKELGLLTQAEVAAILRISERAVGQIERRACDKIRRHLMQFWREWTKGEIKEAGAGEPALSQIEIAAVYRLARTNIE